MPREGAAGLRTRSCGVGRECAVAFRCFKCPAFLRVWCLPPVDHLYLSAQPCVVPLHCRRLAGQHGGLHGAPRSARSHLGSRLAARWTVRKLYLPAPACWIHIGRSLSDDGMRVCVHSLSHGYRTDTKNISAVSKYFTTMPYRLDEVSDMPSSHQGVDSFILHLKASIVVVTGRFLCLRVNCPAVYWPHRLRCYGGNCEAFPPENSDCRSKRLSPALRLRTHARSCRRPQRDAPRRHGAHLWACCCRRGTISV